MIPDRNFGWRGVRAWLAVAVILAFTAFAGALAQAASFQTLEIATKSGVHIFSVEIATTEDEKQKGLMYRRELADGKGMRSWICIQNNLGREVSELMRG